MSGNGQSGSVGDQLANALVVKVVDAGGSGLANITVHWAITGGGGNLSATQTTTDQTGQTLVSLTLGATPGANTVTASVGTLTPAQFSATAIGLPAKLSYGVQPSGAIAGSPIVQAVQVVVQDVNGTTVPNAANSVTLAITSGTGTNGATLGGTVTKAAVNGVATFSDLTIDKVGTGYTLTATASSLTSAVSSPFNINSGPAAKLAILTQPSSVYAASTITPAVQVAIQDAQGNTATTATNNVTVAITAGTGTAGAQLHGTLTRAAASGVATFNDLNIDRSGTNYTLTATASGLTSAVSTQFSVTTGVATHLAFVVQPTDIVAGRPITPAVQVAIMDAGNNITTATDSIVAIFRGLCCGTPSGTFVRPAVNGIATFDDLTFNRPATGAYLEAEPRYGNTLAGANSTRFDVLIGPPARVVLVNQPSDIMDSTPLDTLRVLVQDSVGNTIKSSTASITLSIAAGTGTAGATLLGTTTRVADTGLAVFDDLSVDSIGTGYRVAVASSGLAGDTTIPFRVAGPFYAAQVNAGLYSVNCALVAGGAGYCWGYNGNGALGDGTTNGTRAPVAVSGGLTFADIHTGLHSCGVTTGGGAAYCWGLGLDGELGNGGTADSHTPTPVSGGLTFATVSTGVYHTCALTPAGAAYCWGDGGFGVIGDTAALTGSTTPRLVNGNHTWANLSAGYAHSCAVTTVGEGYCWGDGSYGDLGNGSQSAETVPHPVNGGFTFSFIAAGGSSDSCGLTTSGAAYCWGVNNWGQLGDGSTSSLSLNPVPVAGGLTFTTIRGGSAHYCGLVAGGAMYCWGMNRSGQLGTGDSTSHNTPVPVSGGISFTSVSAGGDHTCGIATTGIVYCWGLNSGGQLGNRSTRPTLVPARVSAP